MIQLDEANSPVAMHAIMAIFGALTHALSAHRAGKTKSPLDFITLTIMSSFTGVIFLLIATAYIPNETYLIGAIAGTGGWLGIEGMSMSVDYIQKKFFNKT